MLAAGAAESDCEVAFPLVDVVRKQVNQQIRDAGNELLRLGKRANVLGDAGMASGERPKLRHEVRIRQEANIKDEVGVLGNALPETEADAGDQNALLRRLLMKAFVNMRAEFVHVEFRSVDDKIREPANCSEVTTFLFQSGFHGCVGAERMRTAGLAESAQQDGIGGLKKDDSGWNHAPDRLENFRQLGERGALAHIHNESGTADIA